MAEAIGQVLPLALVVALSPVPIIAVVLMLGTPRARANGPAFLLGWALGLAVVGAVVLIVAGAAGAGDDAEPATWVLVLKVVLGLLLVVVAVQQWRGRPRRGAESELPAWMRKVDTFTPGRSLAIAVALSAVNPKNLVIVVAAAATIAQTGIDAGDQAIALGIFVLVCLLGPGVPVAAYLLLGERARRALDELKAWMGAHNAAIMAVLCLVIGVKLIGDAITGLG